MPRLAGQRVVAVDFTLPAVVTAFGNGTNTVTATTFTDLPTTSCVAAVTNPHPTVAMICLVEFGAWLHTTASAIRCCPRVSGSVTIAAGIGAGGPIGWGEIPLSGNSGNPQQRKASATYSLPVSATAATFTMQAHRDSADGGTQVCNYATLRIVPLHFNL